MLDAWIIEQLKKKEKEIEKDDRPVLELPLYEDIIDDEKESEEEKEVVVIQL